MNRDKQGKIWGSTQEIISKNGVSIHRLFIEKDSYCSKHMHEFKANMFWVESGRIIVEEWNGNYGLVDKTELVAGESHCVPPKMQHRFMGLENSVVYEIYYVEMKEDDIVREDVGGRLQ
jgi:mannose-6-phosphate isomerase-like protein (cupin superfamily)